ncbi:hypothetical protein ASG42_14895 [Rhizobium sp. Leaf391]|uniref:hypothetical protein n=1 Tax=Rhizobium sp. Leaf391 TaxID=1736360 RepID=UPI000712933E|nr:hypothetical protein [Rhizobium sp. Leaf391]KQS89043.1 hypothetical protein ASG42_14895 [Rhizobium sp. Leaf391]
MLRKILRISFEKSHGAAPAAIDDEQRDDIERKVAAGIIMTQTEALRSPIRRDHMSAQSAEGNFTSKSIIA